MGTEVCIKRVYDPETDDDGLRILVDRLWPRGMKKESLRYDIWAKEITPSTTLRMLFHTDPEANWDTFTKGYEQELSSSQAFGTFIEKLKEINPQRITLLYAYKNKVKNHAIILQQAICNALHENEKK